MLRAVSHAHATQAEPFGTITLDSSDRHLRRKLMTTNQGDKVMVDLPEAVLFADGDALVLEDGRTIEIIAAREKLYEVRPGADVPIRHLAWHLGNRHLAAQIEDDRILIQRDHVIRAMLEGLGARVSDVIERFQPVHGAYHHSHAHEHGHEHSDDHDHSHDHGHGDRDAYGRQPGDPHYGHNHGHDHHHDHGDAHSHAHEHGHGREAHGHKHEAGHGKPDKYGRLPGDPHYGHNHG